MGTVPTGEYTEPTPTMTAGIETIEDGRRQIDRIDDEILRLLSERGVVAIAIGALKRHGHSGEIDIVREHQIIARVAGENQGPFTDQQVSTVFFTVLTASRELQQAVDAGAVAAQTSEH